MNYRQGRIREITKQLDDVSPGGVFKIPPYGKTYIKTDRERAGTATVVDLATGQMANLYTSLTVRELEE